MVFLASVADVDYHYLKAKAGIATKEELVSRFGEQISSIDLKALARDVEPFLFDASQADRVALFARWLVQGGGTQHLI